MPEISVIVPLYNQYGRIEKTLSDLLSQTFDDFEVILVDDASTDACVPAAEAILGKSCKNWALVRHTSNRGASAARNTGLDIASGKAVFFLDGDDRAAPETLDLLWNRMRESGSPIAFCGFKVCREKQESGKIYSYRPQKGGLPIPSEKILLAYLKGKRYMNASNVLYNLAFLQRNRIRFPIGCRFAEDREFIVKAFFHAKSVAVVPEPLVSYVQHPKQSTSRMGNVPNKYAHEVGVYLRLRKYLIGHRAEPGLVHLIDSLELPNAVVKMATSAARSGQTDLFWRYVHSVKLVELTRQGRRAWWLKPDLALKSTLFSIAPSLLLGLYRGKP